MASTIQRLRWPEREHERQLKKPFSIKILFVTCLSLLFLILMLSLEVASQENNDRIDFKYMYYRDKNDVWNHTPSFNWFTSISRLWSFQYEQEFDVVSGASRLIGSDLTGKLVDHGVDITSGASQRRNNGQPFVNPWKDAAFDVVSGASKTELRHSEKPVLTYSNVGQVYTLGFYHSSEPDYQSYSPSLSIAHDFFERNTTLNFGYSWFFDDFAPKGSFADQGGKKSIQSGSISVTQVLTPLTLVSLTANGIYSHGYLGHPYNPIILDSGYVIEEHVPGDKISWALSAKLIQGYHLFNLLGSIHLEGRHYMDSWDLVSNDVDLKWYQYFGESQYFRLRARAYEQGATAFYKDQYIGNELYRSSDLRYSKFVSLILGAKIGFPLFDDWHESALLPDRMDLSYDYGIRNTHGDQGTASPYAHYQLFPSSEFYTEGTFMLGLSFDL